MTKKDENLLNLYQNKELKKRRVKKMNRIFSADKAQNQRNKGAKSPPPKDKKQYQPRIFSGDVKNNNKK